MRFVARFVLFAVWFWVGLSAPAALAKPSPYHAVEFSGDRYVTRAPEAQRRPVVRRSRHAKVRYFYMQKRAPAPRARQRGYVAPLTLAQGVGREIARAGKVVLGGRPSGCPHAFCGCGASLYVFGRIIPTLNLAANWLRFPRTAPAPNMVAARRGHVFVLERHIVGNKWLVHDSNSGGHRTRVHPRSIAGFAIVNPRG
jgi:hypothetical protein